MGFRPPETTGAEGRAALDIDLAWLEYDAGQAAEAVRMRAEREHRREIRLAAFPRIYNPRSEVL